MDHPHGVAELYSYKLDEVREAESLLPGRTTYEGFLAAWPERDGEFADKMNGMPKHVATTTLHELGWNATPLSGDVAAAVTDLRNGQTVARSSSRAAPRWCGRCWLTGWSTSCG